MVTMPAVVECYTIAQNAALLLRYTAIQPSLGFDTNCPSRHSDNEAGDRESRKSLMNKVMQQA